MFIVELIFYTAHEYGRICTKSKTCMRSMHTQINIPFIFPQNASAFDIEQTLSLEFLTSCNGLETWQVRLQNFALVQGLILIQY